MMATVEPLPLSGWNTWFEGIGYYDVALYEPVTSKNEIQKDFDKFN